MPFIFSYTPTEAEPEGFIRMDESTIRELLEELIEGFGVKIRYEAIKQDEDSVKVVGGLCVFKGEYVLIVNTNITAREKIETLAKALKHFDLDRIYIRPALRELLDKIPEQEPCDLGSHILLLKSPQSTK